MRPDMYLRCLPTIPQLSWAAEFDRRHNKVDLIHGRAVESLRGQWIVEGVWDGPFADGGFDRSSGFFGSGLKLVDRGLLLVPSAGIVDRILYCEFDDRLVASNSLALLLAHTGATLDPQHNYRKESFAATNGIDHYTSSFRIIHPSIREFKQLYYTPLLVTPDSVERQTRNEPPSFPDYQRYFDYLRRTLAAIHANSQSPLRRGSMKLFTTISAGYDSTAVTALMRDFPIDCAYTSRRSNSSIIPLISRHAAIDDGAPIAKILNVPIKYLDRGRVPSAELELLFLAPSANDPELIFQTMAMDLEGDSGVAMVLMGYHGDKVWDRNLPPALANDQLKRGDMSGLNLSEIRLQAGFIVVATPFVGARRIADLVAISNSPEMRPWRLGTAYDRPIPRRIVEEAGVPRPLFGHRKRAVVQCYDFPINLELRQRFLSHLRKTKGWSAASVRSMSRINKLAFPVLRAIQKIGTAIRLPVDRLPLNLFERIIDLPAELHVWALTELACVYRARLQEMHKTEEPPRSVGPAVGSD